MTTASPAPLALAIDQGGHASRALVFNQRGETIAEAHHPLHTRTPRPGWVEHDAELLMESVHRAVADAMDPLGKDRIRVAAAGLACQRSSIVCWDAQTGQALSPVISWQDQRAAPWLATFNAQAAMIQSITGLRLSPHYGASKMRWCLDHLPAVRDAARRQRLRIGPLASFIINRLVTSPACLADPANASRTLLWNLNAGDWDDRLLQLFGIPRTILPHCCASRGPFGHMLAGGRSVPLRVVTGDQPAALFAQGQPDPGALYVNMGTGVFIQRVTPTPVHVDGLLTGIAHTDRHRRLYTLEGTINGGARALQWLADKHGIDNLTTDLPHWLNEVDCPGYFLNGVAGLAAPYWRMDFSSRFIDAAEPRQMAVSVVESIVFLAKTIVERMLNATLPHPTIVASGGLAQLDGLCQRLADACQLHVQRPRQTEATARGTAFLALDGPASWTPLTGADFTPRANPPLAGRFREWRRLMERALQQTPRA